MGFPRHVTEHFLKLHKENEEEALNAILSTSEADLKKIPDPNAKTSNSSGLFGKVWGRKS